MVTDTVRPDVPKALKGLRKSGVHKLVMLTGDRESVGKAVAEKLGLHAAMAGWMPGINKRWKGCWKKQREKHWHLREMASTMDRFLPGRCGYRLWAEFGF